MRLIFSFFLIFISAAAGAQVDDRNPDRELYRVNKVKSVKTYESRHRNGKHSRNDKLTIIYTYDTTGRLIETFSELGFLLGDYHRQYTYDSLGNVSEEISFFKDEPLVNNYTYKYENGKITEQKSRNESWYFTYDSAGNRITEKWLMMGDRYPDDFYLDSFAYNSKNQVVKMTRYTNDKQLFFHNEFTYDDAGNQIMRARYQHGSMTNTWYYHYDGNHHMTGMDYYNSRMEKSVVSYDAEYNASGLVTSRISGGRYIRFEYEYY